VGWVKPVGKQELRGLKQIYAIQYQLAVSFEGLGQTFTPTDPRLEKAITALGLPDIRTQEGRQAYANLLEQKRQRAESVARNSRERWGW
jgi:hypothetical protein